MPPGALMFLESLTTLLQLSSEPASNLKLSYPLTGSLST